MGLLDGKIAIVTGASSGIGHAAARRFAAEGAAVIVTARREDRLARLVDTIESAGGEAMYVPGDVTDPQIHSATVAAALEKHGRLDIAFNNAGTVGAIAPLADLPADQWTSVVAVNLTSAFLAARVQLPAMLLHGGGSVIFTGSFVGASSGMPGMAAYGAAKAGLLGLVKGITADYGDKGIRAHALLPGGTDTDMAGGEEQKAWAAGLHAMKRIAAPEEIANAALFLASDLSSFVSGAALWADGGNSAVKL